jgi:type I restriction enzyme S subunit
MIEEVRLEDLVTLQRGFDITEKVQKAGSVPVISSGGISSYHSEFKVNGPGVVIGRKGTLGKVFYTSENYWPHDTSLWVKDFKGNDPRFIYYLLQVLHFERFDAGAANPTLNRNHIHSLKLKVPRKEYRTQIASILSAYDELIDNNKQRIKLLEEMAEEIYKEWFVRMRFPGYETCTFHNIEGEVVPFGTVGALPEGWVNMPLSTIVEIKKGKNITEQTIVEGNIPVVAGGLSPAYFHNVPNTVSPTITISASGANAGFVNIYYEDVWASDCSFVDTKATKYIFFFYLLLTNRQKEIFFLQKGSAQPHVYPRDIMSLKMMIPSNQLIQNFEQNITPFFEETKTLSQKNLLLQQTRDLLLPRLISGKLSVEHLLEENAPLRISAEPEPVDHAKKSSNNNSSDG